MRVSVVVGGAGAVPPRAGGEQAPTAIYLHGIQGRPENGCPWVGSDAFGWLVCPNATIANGNGTFSWAWSSADTAVITRAEALARARGATDGPPVLVGFSQGAYIAARIATERPGRYRALVLIGADVPLDGRSLARAGVTRVALLAGDHDGASLPMRRAANTLAAAGIDARFTSLGRAGHTYVPETADHAARLSAALRWAATASRPES